MLIDTILWDVDGTLLDFDMAEMHGVRGCLQKYQVEVSDEEIAVYKKINQEFWEMLERGEITKAKLVTERFVKFLRYIGHEEIDVHVLNKDYQEALSYQTHLTDGALEILKTLQEREYRQYVVTNGTAFVQHRKLHLSGIDQYMTDLFISEELGVVKPQKQFFDLCASRIPNYNSEKTLIIGDSITSDMRGGNLAGIRCCWYNPLEKSNTTDVRIDCEIRELKEILPYLEAYSDIGGNDNGKGGQALC